MDTDTKREEVAAEINAVLQKHGYEISVSLVPLAAEETEAVAEVEPVAEDPAAPTEV